MDTNDVYYGNGFDFYSINFKVELQNKLQNSILIRNKGPWKRTIQLLRYHIMQMDQKRQFQQLKLASYQELLKHLEMELIFRLGFNVNWASQRPGF